jgi:hypothetical protein
MIRPTTNGPVIPAMVAIELVIAITVPGKFVVMSGTIGISPPETIPYDSIETMNNTMTTVL